MRLSKQLLCAINYGFDINAAILLSTSIRSIAPFSFFNTPGRSRTSSSTAWASRKDSCINTDADIAARPWIHSGLLFSSFTDGLLPNQQAHAILRRGIVRAMLVQYQRQLEQGIEESVLHSPCTGPDIAKLDRLQVIDHALQQMAAGALQDNQINPLAFLPPGTHTVRIVYIPTAMYALRPESTNAPGKQRQRARADAKSRRDDIVNFLKEKVFTPAEDDQSNDNSAVDLAVVTLDLDDGSIKQPQHVSTQISASNSDGTLKDFPKIGKEALRKWSPHLVYVQGGNTFWLYHCLMSNDWQTDFIDTLASETCVYCGSSAGTILVGAQMQTACWKEWDDPRVVSDRPTYNDWADVSGLGLVGAASFFPHMEQRWEALVEEKSLRDIVPLREEDVMYVDGTSKNTAMLPAELSNVVNVQ